MSQKYPKNNRGFATLEVLIAFAIVMLCIGAVMLMTFGNQSLAIDSQNNSEAISKAQKMLEDIRAAARFDFALVNPSSTAEASGPLTYAKTMDVRQVDLYTKQATSTVSWISGGRNLSVFFTTFLTNPDAVTTGSTCSSILSGDWKNPIITSYEFGKDLIDDESSGFPITAIDVYKSKLYISVNNSNGNNLPTFFIFSLTNPAVPTLISSADNDPTVKLGLNAIRASDNYAYGANSKQSNFATCVSGTCGQLQIFNTSVMPPVVVSTFKMPGVTGSAGQAIGTSIAYKKDLTTGKTYAYLGLAKTAGGPEFNVIDVTNPASPVYKGGYSVGYAVNSIFIKDNYAYVASPNSENMTILDITDPTSPARAGGYTPSGGSNGLSVHVIGNTAYLGRAYGTTEFYVLNTANPGSVGVLGSKDIGTGNTTSINSISVRDYLAFLITNEKFEVWNISNPSSIVPWTPSGTTSDFQDLPGGKGTAMDCEGNYMYVGSLPASDKGYVSIITAN